MSSGFQKNSNSNDFLKDDIEAEAAATAASAADSAGERAEPIRHRRWTELLLVRQPPRPDEEVRQVRPEGSDADAGVRHQRGLPLLQVEEERRRCR